MSEASDNEEPKVSFYVTGFGPFQNVPDNPTTVIVNKIVDYLKQREDVYSLSSVTRTLIIETSAEATRKQIDALYETITKDIKANRDQLVVLLHLGVNYKGVKFQFEACAYNDADFRIPDERGYRPVKQPILDHCSIGTPLETLLDIPELVAEMNNNESRADKMAVQSTDPGRFVCNFTYCYSLDKFGCCKQDKQVEQETPIRCLFLHVPPFTVVSEEDQLLFVAHTMEAIYRQVTSIKVSSWHCTKDYASYKGRNDTVLEGSESVPDR